jgi:NTP pyrophosphatase (non-canonical NTP hydrolase)
MKMLEARESINTFAVAMETKLRIKDDDLGTNGWLHDETSIEFLVDRLKEEVEELLEVFNDCKPNSMKEECIDVANFAMMIYDRISKRK